MTIQLTRATYVSGVLEAAASQHTLDAATEAAFVSNGSATWVGAAPDAGGVVNPAFLTTTPSGGVSIAGPSGSAGFNDAGLHGADPAATAAVNATAINAALAAGGYVTLTAPGTYYINSTLLIPSNTHFELGEGVIIRRTQGVDMQMLRNVNANSVPFNITTLALYTTAPFNTGRGAFVQASCATPHGLSVGKYVFVAGALPNEYNGVHRVVAVPDSTHLVYALALYNDITASRITSPATVNTGTSGTNMSTVTTVSGSPIITLPINKAYAYPAGMQVSCTNFTGVQTVVSNDGANHVTLSSNATASSGAATLTSTQYAYSSIVGMAADHNITISGGTWYQDWYTEDGSTTVTTGLTKNGLYSVVMGRVARLTARDMNFDNVQIGLVGQSLYDATIDNLNSKNSGSTLQLMSGGRNVTASRIRGNTWDVMCSLLMGNWYRWYAPNFEYLTDMEGLVFRDLSSEGSLYTLQLSGQAGVKLRDVVIDGITGTCEPGQGLIGIYDDLGIGSGFTVDSIVVNNIRTNESAPHGTAIGIAQTVYSTLGPTVKSLVVDGFSIYVQTSTESSTSPYGISMATASGILSIGEVSLCNGKFWSSAATGNACINMGDVSLYGSEGNGISFNNVTYTKVHKLLLGGYSGSGATYTFNGVNIKSSGSLIYGLLAASTNCKINLVSVSKSGAGVDKVLNAFNASSSGSIYVGNVDFSPVVAGSWLDTGITANNNWRAFWSNPFNTVYAPTASAGAFTPDLRYGHIHNYTMAGAVTCNNALGGGSFGTYQYPFTLVVSGDGNTLTFGSNYVLAANAGQAGQVLTTTNAKKMVLAFQSDGTKMVQTNIGSWN